MALQPCSLMHHVVLNSIANSGAELNTPMEGAVCGNMMPKDGMQAEASSSRTAGTSRW
jgi:hypothetical protein